LAACRPSKANISQGFACECLSAYHHKVANNGCDDGDNRTRQERILYKFITKQIKYLVYVHYHISLAIL